MNMQIIVCEQGSPEWFEARRGIPTASEFKTIVGIKKDARDKLTRKKYMRKLAGEIITEEPMETYINPHMERGKIMEAEARDVYALTNDVSDLQRVGFIRSGNTGCSPDSLIGKNGGLEIKTALPDIQIERLESGSLPPEHFLQVQGNLWLAERGWWDFVSYWPKLPMLTIRVHRDEKTIRGLSAAVDTFNEELFELVERIRGYNNTEYLKMKLMESAA